MRPIIALGILCITTLLYMQCSTAQKIQEEAPIKIDREETYYQSWIAGVKGGGSGINLFIPVKKEGEVVLDSVYFKGMSKRLERNELEDHILYIGRFKTATNQPEEIIMHLDPKKEVENKAPALVVEKIPFELADDEAVISYKQGGKTLYFKIQGIQERPMQQYPRAIPQ